MNGNYTSTSNLEACSVVINSGSNVVFNAGHTLIVGNEVTVNGTGSLTINNNAALRQINAAATNTGNIVVKRDSAPMIVKIIRLGLHPLRLSSCNLFHQTLCRIVFMNIYIPEQRL